MALWSGGVALLFATAVSVAVATSTTLGSRVALGLAFIAIAATPIGEDYLFLFGFLIALGTSWWFAPQRLVPTAVGLGSLCGVAALTKFTLAIDCGGAATLFLIGNIALASPERRALWVRASLAFSTGFLALALTTFAPGTHQIVVAFTAIALAISSYFVSPRLAVLATLASSSVALAGILVLSPAIVDYVRVSLAVAGDYSSAMSYQGPAEHTLLALALMALIAIPLLGLMLEGNIGLSAALAFALFGGFKHAFVRQDLFHILYFAVTALAVAAIAFFAVRSLWARRLGLGAVVAASFGLVIVSPYSATHTPILSGLAPVNLTQNSLLFTDLFARRARLSADNAAALEPDRLPPAIVAKLGAAPVDIEPVEATIAIASGLNWSPVPTLQAYAAYDRLLDDLNLASIRDRPLGHVLYTWDAIDSRYAFGDSPQMMLALACRYAIDGPPATTLGGTVVSVLAGPTRDRCTPAAPTMTQRIRFGQIVTIDHDPQDSTLIETLAIETHYSFLGRLRKSLFRIGYLYLTLYFDDKTTVIYRIVPEAAALGMIVEPSPRSQGDAQSFFATTLRPNVEAISVSTDEPTTFSSDLTISLSNRHRASVKRAALITR